ncbi:B2 bradykinin receptor isoform X2 [Amia ocellicauda]|uniref:B2 bradykinin receptor isoform X2 n=1 Tax=Amia ocellicauda TaxID=2972642 RepID=UPI0034641C58
MGSNTTENTALILNPDNSSVLWSNQTNATTCPTDGWDWLYAMQPVYMAIICVLGIIGNAFVLCVFCFHRKQCTVPEVYLGNLAVADLLMVSCLPFWAVTVANHFNWQFGSFCCRLINVGISMNMYCSIYFLVLVSIDRYLALVKTMSHGRLRSVSCAKLSCLGIWVFGFLMSTPIMLYRRVEYLEEYTINACYIDYPTLKWEIYQNIVLTFSGFLIPSLIISYSTFKIIVALKNKTISKFNAFNTEKKATLLILTVLLVFFLCWIPFHAVTFLNILFKSKVITGCHWEHYIDISNQFSTYLAYSNSCFNPVLYVIVGKNFRKKAKELLMCLKRGMVSESTQSHYSSTLKTFA